MHAAVPGALVRGRLATHPPAFVLFLEDVADAREPHALPALTQRTGVSATTNFTVSSDFRNYPGEEFRLRTADSGLRMARLDDRVRSTTRNPHSAILLPSQGVQLPR
jgi:hypothetical protein